jgi:hypothetical protein
VGSARHVRTGWRDQSSPARQRQKYVDLRMVRVRARGSESECVLLYPSERFTIARRARSGWTVTSCRIVISGTRSVRSRIFLNLLLCGNGPAVYLATMTWALVHRPIMRPLSLLATELPCLALLTVGLWRSGNSTISSRNSIAGPLFCVNSCPTSVSSWTLRRPGAKRFNFRSEEGEGVCSLDEGSRHFQPGR